MSERPEPCGIPVEDAVAVPDPRWRTDEGRRCRWAVGPGGTTCKAPSVAALNRERHTSRRGRVADWWAYCGDHLYGRWIEDGQVMHWIRKPEETS